MKEVGFILVLIGSAWVLGFCQGKARHVGDYARGFEDGYHAPRTPTAEDKVVTGLLCKYAEVACSKPKK